jgi:hypothetical protein
VRVLGLEGGQPGRDPLRAQGERCVPGERAAQLRRPLGLLRGAARRGLQGEDLVGVGVQAAPEQGPHLLLADPARHAQVRGTGADPPAGRVPDAV